MPDLNLSPAIPIRRAPVTGTPHDLVVLTYDELMHEILLKVEL